MKFLDINPNTAEGRLLLSAIDTIVETRNLSDNHAPVDHQKVFDELAEDLTDPLPVMPFKYVDFKVLRSSDHVEGKIKFMVIESAARILRTLTPEQFNLLFKVTESDTDPAFRLFRVQTRNLVQADKDLILERLFMRHEIIDMIEDLLQFPDLLMDAIQNENTDTSADSIVDFMLGRLEVKENPSAIYNSYADLDFMNDAGEGGDDYRIDKSKADENV